MLLIEACRYRARDGQHGGKRTVRAVFAALRMLQHIAAGAGLDVFRGIATSPLVLLVFMFLCQRSVPRAICTACGRVGGRVRVRTATLHPPYTRLVTPPYTRMVTLCSPLDRGKTIPLARLSDIVCLRSLVGGHLFKMDARWGCQFWMDARWGCLRVRGVRM